MSKKVSSQYSISITSSNALILFQAWKEQIKKAKELYEEAKAASASQIDRFYLSFCGGGGSSQENTSALGEQPGEGGDSSQTAAATPGCHGLLSATASSLGGLAAATVRRSSFHSGKNKQKYYYLKSSI